MVGYDAQAEHSIALGRTHAVHVSTFPSSEHSKEGIQLRRPYCTAIDGDWTAPDEAQARVRWHGLCSLERSASCHVAIAIRAYSQ
jgi:hypothetical protein